MRPVLLGMNNPVSVTPSKALYPLPSGCTGNRLWRMLHDRTGASMTQYRNAFERRNVLTGEWDTRKARQALLGVPMATASCYEEWYGTIGEFRGREVVCLGTEIRDILDLDHTWVLPQERHGATWRPIPHPSGRNHWYNDADNRETVAVLLEELYNKWRRESEEES